MHRELCLCAEMEPLRLDTRVVLLMHRREFAKTTNTGRLALLSLANSELRLRGYPGEQVGGEDLVQGQGQPLLLFPDENARELDTEWVAELRRPVTLIVPDGTWRQASKVLTRVPGLESVPRIRLSEGPPTVYRLRREIREGGLATFEAIARALGVLEGPEVQSRLEALFHLMVERTLRTRGHTP